MSVASRTDIRWSTEACMPYVLMIARQLCLAVQLTLLQSVLNPSNGINPIILVVYEQLVSVLVICSLALIFERGKRPKPSLQVLCSAFFLGFLQIPVGEVLLTASLSYIAATFQSVALNMIPWLVFVMAVVTRRERFRFLTLSGQVKMWGIIASATGAIVMVVTSEKGAQVSTLTTSSSQLLGYLMVVLAVLAVAVSNLLVERIALNYPAHITLSAMINASGTLLTVVLAAFIERNPSSWRIWRSGNIPIFVILYAGIVVTGLSYSIQNWCIHNKGPVFATAFSPLLIVFSFLLDTFVFGGVTHIQSIISAMLVVGGLYLLLWEKSRDFKVQRIDDRVQKHEGLYADLLLPNEV